MISRTSRIWFALLVAKATPDVRPNKAWWANTGQMLLAAPIMIGIYCKVHYQMSNLSKTVKIIIFHFPKKKGLGPRCGPAGPGQGGRGAKPGGGGPKPGGRRRQADDVRELVAVADRVETVLKLLPDKAYALMAKTVHDMTGACWHIVHAVLRHPVAVMWPAQHLRMDLDRFLGGLPLI